MKKFEQIAYDEAKQSTCYERKVGAILVSDNEVIGQGHNYSLTCGCLEEPPKIGAVPNCPKDVVHAEVACLDDARTRVKHSWHYSMFVTHPPCNKCRDFIRAFEQEYNCIIEIYVCEQFLKFDDDKIRFDLIPPEWPDSLARILTYGAKKYKPNNWRKGEIDRYIGAVHRHLNAWQQGDLLDKESGMPHLWHAMCNIGFLITLEESKHED